MPIGCCNGSGRVWAPGSGPLCARSRAGALTMGDLVRLQVMYGLAVRRLTRRRAATLRWLSERQIRRLYRAFRRHGAQALASRRRGRLEG